MDRLIIYLALAFSIPVTLALATEFIREVRKNV